MFDLILFGTIGLLLLILMGFLVLVIRDHMKSKSFELYVHQSQEEIKKEANRSAEEKVKSRENAPIKRRTPAKPEALPTEKSESDASAGETTPSTPSEPEVSKKEQERPEPEPRPTLYRLHPDTGAETVEIQKKADAILRKDYGHFSHQRLVEGMGLSSEEADEFVVELIHQLENAINDLDRALETENFTEIEHITHGLKGAALNIGEGGVADLLTEYNTYMKENHELPVIRAYQTLLKQTVSDLKVEYSQVA
ncbi:Hpt domain-containing protein [Hydrogenimonas urashimensis]|uniref:Hpt domain-containing protein n=1 Tax=Hydrogenimonas urashimensis TaxID=2740515 RepID=UPI00191646FB|nr:Hpt domain-containing protein [Hydrogenimonas urashimensis]